MPGPVLLPRLIRARLAAELGKLYPDVPITVLNRGINGQDAPEMIARFKQDVIDERPDLVIWQLGTNAAFRDVPIEDVGKVVREGIGEIKNAGADVLLVDPQFAPQGDCPNRKPRAWCA